MSNQVILIDLFAILLRVYTALPKWKNKAGVPTSMVVGFVKFLNKQFLENQDATFIFCSESKHNSQQERGKLDENYKGNRTSVDEQASSQIGVCIKMLKDMGFKVLTYPGYEADDVIATLATSLPKLGYTVQIYSTDKDFKQLVTIKTEDSPSEPGVYIVNPFNSTASVICVEDVENEYGIHPKDFTKYQALAGDLIDTIPAILTPKRAMSVVKTMGDKIEEALEPEQIERYRLNLQLVTLKTDLNLEFDIDKDFVDLQTGNPLLLKPVIDLLTEYEAKKTIAGLYKWNT